MADRSVDLFVIGGGSGGVRAARIAAGYGSHVHQEIEDAAGFGWSIPQSSFDWPTLIANKDKEIARLEAAYAANLDKAGAEIVKARAVFEDAHTLSLSNGERVQA